MCGKLNACCLPELNQRLSIQPVRFKQINSLNGPIPACVISLLVFFYYLDIPSVAHFTKICPWEDTFFKIHSLPPAPHTPRLSYFKCGKKGRTKRDKMTDVTVNLANESRGSR